MKNIVFIIVVVSGLIITPFSFSQEARVVLRSTVVGNQEQPKVLYLVPWQPAATPKLIYQPLQSLVDGVFSRIERKEFLRALQYKDKLTTSLISPSQ